MIIAKALPTLLWRFIMLTIIPHLNLSEKLTSHRSKFTLLYFHDWIKFFPISVSHSMRELKFYVRLSYIFFYADAWIDYLSCFLNKKDRLHWCLFFCFISSLLSIFCIIKYKIYRNKVTAIKIDFSN